jgi:hypothetical protein
MPEIPSRNSRAWQDRPPLQMRTIIYNDEAAPWSRSNHLFGIRLLPSSDDSNNIFSRALEEQGLRKWSTRLLEPTCEWYCLTVHNFWCPPPILECTCDWDCLTMNTFCPLTLILCLFKAKPKSIPQR